MNGGVEKYEAEKVWPAVCILTERHRKGHKQYLMRWDGYDHTYDTWEWQTELKDRSLEVYFCSRVSGIRHEVWLFRHYLAHDLQHTRTEKGKVEVKMPGIHGAALHTLLRFFACPHRHVLVQLRFRL